MVRAGGLRRHLGIPNPINYTRLCDFVTCNWTNLKQCATRSPFSLTIPVDGNPERAISPKHTLDDRMSKRAEIRARSKFILRTDVNRFYPSIYTHSIPWAIHSKSVVKAAMAAMGLLEETYRLPMVPPRPESKARIEAVLKELGLLKAALV